MGALKSKAKPHFSFDQKAQRTVCLHSSCPFPHTYTHKPLFASPTRSTSKTLSAKTTTTWQDQHIPARPYGESKSITHAQTSTQALLKLCHKHVWTMSVFKNVQLSLLLKESNFSCKSSSSLYFWSSINSCKQERETELAWSQTGIDWVDECLSEAQRGAEQASSILECGFYAV